jgi:hypothetical protein
VIRREPDTAVTVLEPRPIAVRPALGWRRSGEGPRRRRRHVAPTADLAVVSIHPSRQAAVHGTRVTFTEVIRNNGPETVEMDTLPQITGGTLVEEVCDLGISPDTPNCEYGDVAPGTSLITKFVIRVTAGHGTLTVRGGVVSESAFEDDNPFNQYRTSSVRIG